MSEFRPRVLLIYGVGVLALTLVAVLGARSGRSVDGASDAAHAAPAMLAEMAPSTNQESDAGPKQTPYVWSASRIGSTLRLRGFVPSEEDRRTVLGMVKAHFADLEVEDRLKIADGGPPREEWLGAVSFGLKQLSYLKQGSTRLLNKGLKVEGEARNSADYDEVKKALAGPMPTGLTLLNDNVRPPVTDPFVFVAALDPNGLTLSGSVPSENMRKQIKEWSRLLFERPTLHDQLQLASGAPKDWGNAVEASLRALSRLDTGKISLSGLVLTIDGVAPDKGTAIEVSSTLKRDLPALFSSNESIRWKEAIISRNAGELLAPRIKDIDEIESGMTTGAMPLEDAAPVTRP
jgi:OOP family OmpA-OmpF porin